MEGTTIIHKAEEMLTGIWHYVSATSILMCSIPNNNAIMPEWSSTLGEAQTAKGKHTCSQLEFGWVRLY